MRVQRTKQVLREIEGGSGNHGSHLDIPEYGGMPPYSFEQGENNFMNSSAGGKHGSAKGENVIHVAEIEVLGSDYCARKPVFLPHSLKPMIKKQHSYPLAAP